MTTIDDRRHGILVTMVSSPIQGRNSTDSSSECTIDQRLSKMRLSSPNVSLGSLLQDDSTQGSTPSFQIYSKHDLEENQSEKNSRQKAKNKLSTKMSSSLPKENDKENIILPKKIHPLHYSPVTADSMESTRNRNHRSHSRSSSLFLKHSSRSSSNLKHARNSSSLSSASAKRLSIISLSSTISSTSAGLKSMAEKFRRSSSSQSSLEINNDVSGNTHHHHLSHLHMHSRGHSFYHRRTISSSSYRTSMSMPSSSDRGVRPTSPANSNTAISQVTASALAAQSNRKLSAYTTSSSTATAISKNTSSDETATSSKPQSEFNDQTSNQSSSLKKKSSKFHLRHSISLKTLSTINSHSDREKETSNNRNSNKRRSILMNHRISLSDIGRLLRPLSKTTNASRRASIDLSKCDISLPVPQHDTREKLNHKLRNSSSILSISSFVSSNQGAKNRPRRSTGVSSGNSRLIALDHKKITPMKMCEVEGLNQRLLLKLCNQRKVYSFQRLYDRICNQNSRFKCISHTLFSDVYAEFKNNSTKPVSAFKIIPFGDIHTEQMQLKEVIQELSITMAMSSISGYIKIKLAKVVKGPYPKKLLDAWNENSNIQVGKRSSSPNAQNYLIIRMEHGGQDLEHYKITNWKEAYDILLQVADSLATGENKASFEHRDLHWGNVLINKTGNNNHIGVSLIDFSLSRARVGTHILFTGLDNPNFFRGRGDYQFTTYRMMRNMIMECQRNKLDPMESITTQSNNSTRIEIRNDDKPIDWSVGCPRTNLLWIHYLLDRIINHKGLKPLKARSGGNKEHKCYHKIMEAYKILDPTEYNGATNHHLKKKKASKSLQDFNGAEQFALWFHELN